MREPRSLLDLVPIREPNTCRTCRYWRLITVGNHEDADPEARVGLGLCCIDPPRIGSTTNSRTDHPEGLWPTTYDDDGCGKWQSSSLWPPDDATADQAVFDRFVDSLSARARRIVTAAGVTDWPSLRQITMKQVLNTRSAGVKTISELAAASLRFFGEYPRSIRDYAPGGKRHKR